MIQKVCLFLLESMPVLNQKYVYFFSALTKTFCGVRYFPYLCICHSTKKHRILDIRNPLVWLRRIRHRCGYGVHSPFAFHLITQVVYSPGRYYAYKQLDGLHGLWERLTCPRRRAVYRLLFRLANARQARRAVAVGVSDIAMRYLRAGCGHTRWTDMCGEGAVDLLVVDKGEASFDPLPPAQDGTWVVVLHLGRNASVWQRMRESGRFQVMFDLHDVGLAIRHEGMQSDYYVVNW